MRLKDQARRTRDAIEAELRRHGAVEISTIHRVKHLAVAFTLDGKRSFITFSGTDTDGRAHYNSIANARRKCRELRGEGHPGGTPSSATAASGRADTPRTSKAGYQHGAVR